MARILASKESDAIVARLLEPFAKAQIEGGELHPAPVVVEHPAQGLFGPEEHHGVPLAVTDDGVGVVEATVDGIDQIVPGVLDGTLGFRRAFAPRRGALVANTLQYTIFDSFFCNHKAIKTRRLQLIYIIMIQVSVFLI